MEKQSLGFGAIVFRAPGLKAGLMGACVEKRRVYLIADGNFSTRHALP